MRVSELKSVCSGAVVLYDISTGKAIENFANKYANFEVLEIKASERIIKAFIDRKMTKYSGYIDIVYTRKIEFSAPKDMDLEDEYNAICELYELSAPNEIMVNGAVFEYDDYETACRNEINSECNIEEVKEGSEK